MTPYQLASDTVLAEALRVAQQRHLPDPNVVLIDVGYRILDGMGHMTTDEITVRVHLRRKLRGEDFLRFRTRHPERVPVSDVIGFAVDVPEGPYRLHNDYAPYQILYWRHAFGKIQDPLCGGVSVSSALVSGAGTLGGKVVDRHSGAEMILSNWHVLAGQWAAAPGVEIFQPGRLDGGGAELAVGQFARHAFADDMDAAVASLNGARDCVNTQLNLAPVRGLGEPALGMGVVKSGRASGVTTGVVTGIGGVAKFMYDGLLRVVRNVVHIAPLRAGAEVSAPGDSGAFWLDAASHHAVALHFAGVNAPEYGLGMAMAPVLDALGVDLSL